MSAQWRGNRERFRKKQSDVFFIAVNLLELQEIRDVMKQISAETSSDGLLIKEKAIIAVRLFQEMAEQRSILLKLNKKSSKVVPCKKNT